MEEIEERTRRWREVTRNLLDQVNSRYQSLLARLQATGEVRLSSPMDIEEAGLDIYVGFRGAKQGRLDQSSQVLLRAKLLAEEAGNIFLTAHAYEGLALNQYNQGQLRAAGDNSPAEDAGPAARGDDRGGA